MLNKKPIKYLLIATLILVLGGLTIILPKSETVHLSEESETALRELNEQYEMVLTDDLLNTSGESTNMLTSIFGAEKTTTPHRGLILSTPEDVLLVQPINEISTNQLKKIADEYDEKIPEIRFEVDQNIKLTEVAYEETVEILENNTAEISEELTENNSEIRIAIIDSGVQVDHPHFEQTTLEIHQNANTIDQSNNVEDDLEHGTHITGIIASNTPSAILMPFKVVSQDNGKLSNVIKAIDLAVESEADIINMSFGVLEDSPALEQVIETTYEETGVIFVAAAGNEGSSEGFYPATYEETIAVGAIYANGRQMKNSNFGEWVDVAARGYRINSATPVDE